METMAMKVVASETGIRGIDDGCIRRSEVSAA